MYSRPYSPPSLQTRLCCLVLLAFLPVLVGLSLDAWQSRRHALELAYNGVADDAVLAANAQTMQLNAVSEMLTMVAISYDSIARSPGDCSVYLRRLLSGQVGFANAGVLDGNGRAVCTAISGPNAGDFSTRAYFREARETGRFAVSGLLIGNISGSRSLVFAYPRRAADGSFAGVIFVSLRDVEFAKLRLAGTKSDSSFTYFDRDGALIVTDPLDSDRPEAQLDKASMRQASQHPGEAVPSFVRSADGTVYIGALVAVAGPAGAVAYVRSTIADAIPLYAWRMGVLRRAGAASLMLMSGLVLCGIFLRRWLVHDLLQTVAFTRMAVAHPVGDVPIIARTAEMHAAMGSVVEMAQRLQDQRAQLALLHDEAYDASVRLENKRLRLSAALERLERMSAQLVNAQEQERKHLARELHDELGQRLTALKLMLHSTLPHEAPGSPGWHTAEREVSELIAQVRAISVSLRPPALDLFPLEVAVRQMLERHFCGSAIDVEFEAAGVPETLDETRKITAYRLVQESLTNITRHAAATRVVVEMNGGEYGDELEIIVRDNGRGFDVNTAEDASRALASSGLCGMRERVELLGGSLQIISGTGQGTRVLACLPIKQTSKQEEHEKEHIAG